MADTYFLSIPTGKIAPIRRRGSLAISQHSAHKQTLLRRATIIFAILVMSMGQVWGVNCSLGQAYLKCNFNGSAYKFADTGNDSDYEYVYNTDSHSAHNLGVLSSGSFTLTYLSWHCWNDWKDADEYTENYFWYYVNSGSTTTRQQNWNGRGDFYPKQENISVTIAYATDASGLYTFHHGWYTKYYECCGSSSYTQKDLNNGSSFDFTYTILPPAVSDFTVTPTGVLSGTGTSADPYLIAYDGTLSLTLSGASQAHSDANSSVQYSVDGSSYGTESGNTTKTISNITATTNQSVTVYAKYYNSNDDLSGEVLTKTVYYKTADWVIAGTMDGEATWPLDTHIFTHWGTNASGKDTGFVEMDLAANTTYEFKVVQRSGNTWYGNDGTMNYADNNGQAWDFCTSAGNCGITTAGAGTYRFTWNSTDKQLTVTYPTSYTVTFGSGTGIDGEVTASGSISGSIASGTYAAAGENITFSQTPLDGYTFEGWFTTNGGNTAVTGMSSSDNVLENISANATVYAKYSPITYTITLNPNGGTGGTASVSIGYNETAPNQGYDGNWYFAITNPTRAGYTFSGWNTAADGTGLDLIDTGGILQGNKDGYTTTGTGDAIVWIHTSDVTLYAKWTDDGTISFTGNTTGWGTASNWSKNRLPTLADAVSISTPVVVDIPNAQAGSIALTGSATLTVQANKGLLVTGTITKNGAAPTAADLLLESSEAGNATLIFNNSNSAVATVQMYSIAQATAAGKIKSWQYMGVPFTGANAEQTYSGGYMYGWKSDGSGWETVTKSTTLNAFTGYSISYPADNHTYVMEGTLAPTTTRDITVPAGKDMVVGNSWTAPIQIKQLRDEDFTNLLKNIYLYNTGMDSTGAGTAASSRYEAGTYLTIPIHSSPYTGDSVISSLQGFFVTNNTASAGSLNLSYADHVRPDAGNSVIAGPMHAPRRMPETEEESPTVLKIIASGNRYDDRLVLLERGDFTTGYDAGWDGEKWPGGELSPAIYVLREDNTKDAVAAIPSLHGMEIAFIAGEDNLYSLRMEFHSDDEEPLYLLDTYTSIYTRVENGATYSFQTYDRDAHTRFILTRSRAPQVVTGYNGEWTNGGYPKAVRYIDNGRLYIRYKGTLYNMQGARVEEKTK